MGVLDKKSEASDLESATKKINDSIRMYWNEHIHDLEVAKSPIGTKGFFKELDDYRFEKLDYLPKVVDFSAYKEKRILEVGCGIGIDLIRFAQNGAIVTGIDLSDVAIDLARKNFAAQEVSGDFKVMNGEHLSFNKDSFDVVYAHGVLQYTGDIKQMIGEIHRVVKPGGEVILMVYNRLSWLNLLSKILDVKLEHEDAPVLNKYSIGEFRRLLTSFKHMEIIPERFPVISRLHGGVKGWVYNTVFVGLFNMIPRAIVRPFGWHIMAKATK